MSTARSTERPPHLKPPAHWSSSPLVPAPQPPREAPEPDGSPARTRYGDWERNGIAIDF